MVTYINKNNPALTLDPTAADLATKQVGPNDITFGERLANSGYAPAPAFPNPATPPVPNTSSLDQTGTGNGWYTGVKPAGLDAAFGSGNYNPNPIVQTSDFYDKYITDQNKFFTDQQTLADTMRANLQAESDRQTAAAEAQYQKDLLRLQNSQKQETGTSDATEFRLGRTGTIYGDREKQDLTTRQNAALTDLNNHRIDLITGIKQALATNNLKVASDLSAQYQKVSETIYGAQKDKQNSVVEAAKNALAEKKYNQDYQLQTQKDQREATQWSLTYDLNSNKFNYQQSQDEIQNALAEKKISVDQANSLMDYNLKLRQLDQGNYVVSQDAFGRPIAFNKKTGQFETSVISEIGNQTGIFDSQFVSYRDALNSASIGMNDKQQQRASAQLNSYLQKGDLQGAKEFIVRAASQGASTDQQNQALGRLQAISALSNVKGLLDAYVNKTGDTGIWSGNIQKAAERIGQSNNTDLAKIGSLITQTLQVYRKGMTGVAFSPSESAEYAKVFPDITNVGNLNTVKINTLLDSFNNQQKVFIGNQIGENNYNKIFGEKPKYGSIVEFKLANPEKFEGVKNLAIQQNWSEADTLQYMNHLDLIQPAFNQSPSMDEKGSTAKDVKTIRIGDKPVQVSSVIAGPLEKADQDFFAATGQHLQINESLRSNERQAQLYAAFRSGKGGGRAAPPGQSFHETGQAVDVGNWQEAASYLHKYGFKNNLADDRNHFSIGEFS